MDEEVKKMLDLLVRLEGKYPVLITYDFHDAPAGTHNDFLREMEQQNWHRDTRYPESTLVNAATHTSVAKVQFSEFCRTHSVRGNAFVVKVSDILVCDI